MSEARQRLLVGWKEYLDLPALGISRLKAKMDTGARTSTLHIDSLTVLEVLADGSEMVELTLRPYRRADSAMITARARVLGHIQVTDSGGHPELRPVVETEMVLGPVTKRIAVTLTNRSAMLFRMIVGRKALEGDFQVDVAGKYLLRKWHRSRRRIEKE